MSGNNEYYIVSNQHTQGWVRSFWRPNGCGYTMNLDEAGLYSTSYSKEYPVIDENNILDYGKYDDFYIHKDKVHLLGKRMTCVMN